MVKTDKIIVVGDRILIKPQEDTRKSHGGLYLPPSVAEKEKVQGGYIIKTGPGYPIPVQQDEDEPWKEKKLIKYLPLQAREGDYALFLRRDAIEIEFENEKFLIVPQSAILLLHRDEDLLS